MQDKIRGFAMGDKSYSVGEMVRLLEIWEARRLKIDEATQRASAAQATLRAAKSSFDETDIVAEGMWGRYLDAEDAINRELAHLEGTSTSDWKDLGSAQVLSTVSNKRSAHKSEPSFQDAYGKFIAAIDDYYKARRDHSVTEKRVKTATERQESAESKLASLQISFGAGGAAAATGGLSDEDADSLRNAGVLVIANPSEAGMESGDINPFFISFLAIVSGLLSEQATLRIQSAGERFFRVDDADLDAADHGRWALAVKQEMSHQGKTVGELAALLEVEEEQADDWVEERAPVPEATQLVIAAWLNKPMRELLTDLGPA